MIYADVLRGWLVADSVRDTMGVWVIKWLVGALFVVVMAAAGGYAANIQSRLTTAESVLAARGERITSLEGRATLLEQKFHDIDDALKAIQEGQKEIEKALQAHLIRR